MHELYRSMGGGGGAGEGLMCVVGQGDAGVGSRALQLQFDRRMLLGCTRQLWLLCITFV